MNLDSTLAVTKTCPKDGVHLCPTSDSHTNHEYQRDGVQSQRDPFHAQQVAAVAVVHVFREQQREPLMIRRLRQQPSVGALQPSFRLFWIVPFILRGDVPCAVETERRLGSRLRNHFRRLAEPELRVARSERRHQLRHVLAAVHAPKALGGFQHPGRDPA